MTHNQSVFRINDNDIEFTHVVMYMGVTVGTRNTGKLQKLHEWVVLSDDVKNFDLNDYGKQVDFFDHSTGRQYVTFAGTNLIQATPGNVYKMVRGTDDKSWVKQGDFIGRWPQNDYVVQLQTQHHTNLKYIAARGKTMRDLETNAIFETLKPIRQIYRKSSVRKRHHILAYVIRYLTS